MPFFILSALSCVITFVAQKSGGAVQTLIELSFSGRIENAAVAYVRYLGKTFWPADLCCFYPHPGHWPSAAVWASAVMLLLVCVLAVLLLRRAPFVTVGWFWYLGTLVPVIGLVQVGAQSIADRYTYIPLIGIFMALALGARQVMLARIPKVLPAILAGGVLFACALQTRHQLQFWLNTEVLFRRALAVTKGNPVVREFLANHYFNQGNEARDQGRIAEAVARYTKGLEIWPAHSQLHNNLGLIWHAQSQLTNAIEEYLYALKASPTNVNARNNLAVAFTSEGRLDEAIEQMTEILRLTPVNAAAQNNLGALLARKGDFQQAIVHYQKAIDLAPAEASFHDNLGDAFAKQGRFQEAMACYCRALSVNPADAVAARRLSGLSLPGPSSNTAPARSP